MPNGSLSLPAKLYLLAWDTGDRSTAPGTGTGSGAGFGTGSGAVAHGAQLAALVRAGALTELAQRGLLIDARGRAKPLADAVTGDPVLDGLLELIGESRPRDWQTWVTYHARTTLTGIRDQQLAAGFLRARRRRVLGLPLGREYALERPDVVAGMRDDARRLLRGRQPVGEVAVEDAALVALAAAGELRTVVTAEDAEVHEPRIAALAERSGHAAPGLEKAIAEVRKATAIAVASAVVMAAIAAASSG